MSYLQKEAERIIDLLKRDFVFPDGRFFLEKCENKVFPYHIYPDIGDFLPFLLYFGEDDFVEKQIELYQDSLIEGIMISEFRSFGLGGLAKSYEYTDLLLGLLDLQIMRPSSVHEKLFLNTLDKAIEIFNLEGAISSYYYPKWQLKLPIIDTRDGTLIELFVDAYKLTGNERYFKVAENIFNKLVNSAYYRKHSLLPTFHSPWWFRLPLSLIGEGGRFNNVTICKNNTNSLFGYLSLYKAGNKQALRAIKETLGALEIQFPDGRIPIHYSREGTNIANLTASFPVIDFICDLYKFDSEENHLNFAKKIAGFWIEKQGSTGLFPKADDSGASFIDSETDMIVALNKLFECTGEVKYKEATEAAFQGLVKYHGERDYVLEVDINNGAVINATQRTKFLALALKVFILHIEYEKGSKIYTDDKLYSLLKNK